MRLLIDGDEANNNGNWQWVASVGVDPQPPFRRMLQPARQQARFDPDGAYVRRHVSELRDVPDEYLAEPWTMPEDVQREADCVIGATTRSQSSTTPSPVVRRSPATAMPPAVRGTVGRGTSARGPESVEQSELLFEQLASAR